MRADSVQGRAVMNRSDLNTSGEAAIDAAELNRFSCVSLNHLKWKLVSYYYENHSAELQKQWKGNAQNWESLLNTVLHTINTAYYIFYYLYFNILYLYFNNHGSK